MIKLYQSPKDINYQKNDIFLHFTGNIFGIGCSAFDEQSIHKISNLKGRDIRKGNILLFSSFLQLNDYNIPFLKNKRVFALLNQYSPGNLTVVLPTEDPRFYTISVNRKIAIRIPQSKALRDFIEKIGSPIISTSVNSSGDAFCNDLNVLSTEFADWFDYGLYDPSEEHELPIHSTIIEFIKNADDMLTLECVRMGSIDFDELVTSWESPLIQFVCIGNVCRSPLAEIYVRDRIEKENLHFRVGSCGLLESGRTISEHSQTILNNLNLRHNRRQSIQINEDILQQSMVLLCMTEDIKHTLKHKYRNYARKIFSFAEYTTNFYDIEDPFDMDFQQYVHAFSLIQKYSDDLIDILKRGWG